MNRELFSEDRAPLHHYIPDGKALNPEEEAVRYEKTMQSLPVHLAFLGVGPNKTCHIGFNGPGTPFSSKTHVVNLDKDTITANAPFFDGNKDKVPTQAITQGIQTICGQLENDGVVRGGADRIIMLITGKHKQDAAKLTLEAPIMTKYPSTALRRHGVWERTTILLDSDAAETLDPKTLTKSNVHIVVSKNTNIETFATDNVPLFSS